VCVFVLGDAVQYATPDGVTYKFGGDDAGDSDGGREFGRVIVTFVDALRRNTDQDRLAFGVRTSQRHAALVHVHSATSPDFLRVDLVLTRRAVFSARRSISIERKRKRSWHRFVTYIILSA